MAGILRNDPVWPVDLAVYNPRGSYEYSDGLFGSSVFAFHLARARAAKGLGFDDSVTMQEITRGAPSIRRGRSGAEWDRDDDE
jgi:hypothetical protein